MNVAATATIWQKGLAYGLGTHWKDCFMADGWACVLLLAAPACAAKSQGICTGLAHPVSILRQDKAGG